MERPRTPRGSGGCRTFRLAASGSRSRSVGFVAASLDPARRGVGPGLRVRTLPPREWQYPGQHPDRPMRPYRPHPGTMRTIWRDADGYDTRVTRLRAWSGITGWISSPLRHMTRRPRMAGLLSSGCSGAAAWRTFVATPPTTMFSTSSPTRRRRGTDDDDSRARMVAAGTRPTARPRARASGWARRRRCRP